jgi:N-acetylmuramoyl-L-alanine amidase
MTRLASLTTAAVAPVALAFIDDAYVVRPGDTASEIAAEHDTTVAAIVAANDLVAGGDLIFAGETLIIPSAHGSPTEADRGRPGPNARRTVWHTVQPGDTVTALAVRYHAWTDEIIARNRLSASGDISVGDRLRIPVVLAALPRHRQAQQQPQQEPADSASPDQQAARLEDRLPNPSQQRVRHVIEQVSARYGVDPDLALAVSWQEAGWQQDHVSSAWALGAMQVLPSTGEWIETLIGRDLDLHRLRPNVIAGVVLLRQLTAVAPLPRAVAGYYQGLQSVRDHGMSADTKQYVRNVLYLKAQYEQGNYPY